MELKDYVKDIYLGLNKKETRHTSNDKTFCYELLTIKAINNKFINKNMLGIYENLTKIDEKFLTKSGDIIICSKPPYNVVLIDSDNEGILVPSNFIILRNADIDKEYLYNYLNLLGSNMKFDKKDENTNITKTDIEQVKIIIDDKKIKKISELCSKINKRQKAYGKLLDNDQELIKMVYLKGGIDLENE